MDFGLLSLSQIRRQLLAISWGHLNKNQACFKFGSNCGNDLICTCEINRGSLYSSYLWGLQTLIPLCSLSYFVIYVLLQMNVYAY